MAEKLEFDLSVKSNELSKALKEASGYANTLSSHFAGGLKNSINESIDATKNINKEMSIFSATTIGVAAGQFAFSILQNAISFVTSSIKESIGAFAEQEDALNKLRQSFILTGGASESAVQGVEAFATELEATSKFSDDAIIRQVAFAKSLGTTTAVAKEMVLAAANLSATLGGSLEENTEKLGKTLSGTAGRLQQYIPELKSLTIEQLRAGDAAKIINEKFGGSAQNDLKTYTGSMASLSNAFNNLQESTGEVIVKSKIFGDIYKFIKKSIDDVNTSLSAQTTAQDINNKKQENGSITAEQLANNYKKIDKEIANLNEALKEQQGHSFLRDILLDDNTAGLIMIQIKDLAKAREDLSKIKISAPTADVAIIQEKTKEEVDAMSKRNADLLALNQQIGLAIKANADQEAISKVNNETLRNEEEITRIYEQEVKKAEILAAQKVSSLSLNLDHEAKQQAIDVINAEKKLALVDAYGKKEQASRTALLTIRKNGEDAWTAYEKKKKETELKDQETFLNTAATLSSAKNKELAAIGKAAAITQIAIKTPPAIASSFEFGTKLGGPPLGFAFGGIAAAAMALQAANIAGVGFEQGGIVGSSNGASVGADNRVAQIRDGEMILNANDQKTLFDAIKSGSFGGGNIVVEIDGREVFYAVRRQIQGGAKF